MGYFVTCCNEQIKNLDRLVDHFQSQKHLKGKTLIGRCAGESPCSYWEYTASATQSLRGRCWLGVCMSGKGQFTEDPETFGCNRWVEKEGK